MTRDKGTGSGSCPTCREPGLLLWHAAGSLGAEDDALVRRSLEECDICRLAARDDARLAWAVRLGSRPADEKTPVELVALASGSAEQIAAARLSDSDRKLVEILKKVDSVADADTAPGWGARLRRGWDSLFQRGTWEWLRSPAVAYLLLLGLAYPAYRGLSAEGSGAPRVLDPPVSVDTGTRAEGEALLGIGDDGGAVLTVFVPVDQRLRYRLEILDARGAVRFVDEDVRTFDGIGTLAIYVPQGFLASGGYEVRVTEVDASDATAETEARVFRYPFRLQ